ncbi:hypothetical protein FZEAL_5914 [Fusarium zealandicum]|uniref:Ankyrin n=1 Tax=Fusarium zealandicum TaxID=1053134 RepID=A0A8H4UJH9_9HYPO|nr:hypothetical protein FZEAL_5914 [Fusarium zealandicum]
MNIGGASPSTLRVPMSSASPSGSNNTNTGRPPLWNRSSERKMSRLYLYTTLPLEKIIAVVHSKSPSEAPGKESANKKLGALLNKQPRWLHPRNEEDMVRRLDELSLSPTRTNSSWNSMSSPTDAMAPSLNPSPTPNLMRNYGANPSLTVPPFNQFPPQQPIANRPTASRQAKPTTQQQEPESAFELFLRRTTWMSASTDCTTGSLRRLLNGYSDSYVRSVKKLVKRYTAPINHRAESLSPISDEESTERSWLNDPDSPPTLPNGPYYLPGDFLLLDMLYQGRSPCFLEAEQHTRRSCWCHAFQDIDHSAWVTKSGLSHMVHQSLEYIPRGCDMDQCDPFGNTLLHLMAARMLKDHLFQTLLLNPGSDVINARNSAGQTLLHVLHRDWFRNEPLLLQLLGSLAQRGFDFDARDHYGRAFSHILLAKDVSANLRNEFLQSFSASNCFKRDAFNVTPTLAIEDPERTIGIDRMYTQAMDLDPPPSRHQQHGNTDIYPDNVFSREARLVRFIKEAALEPLLEDSEGRNALHCLAAVTLSTASLMQKYSIDENSRPIDRKRKKEQPSKDPDSSTPRLNARLESAEVLIHAGVDLNHYDIYGNTPLMAFAAQLPEDDDYKVGPSILHHLIAAGAEVDARNRAGETALHVAVRCGRKLAARQLVEDGATVHARDSAGRSVLEVADMKMRSLGVYDTEEYAHLEACRAWLSGQKGSAVQNPTVMQEWGITAQS